MAFKPPVNQKRKVGSLVGKPKAGLGTGVPAYTPRKVPTKPAVKPTAKPGLGAAPAAAAAAKPVVGQHAVPDQALLNRQDTAGRAETAGLGALDTKEAAVKFDYGIEDPTNAFSRVNGLKKMYLTRQKAASAQLASQGQLYSGAHERALSRTRADEEQARAALRQSYDAAMNEIGSARTGVKFDTEQARNAAFEEWLARAPEADVAVDPNADGAAPAASAAPAPAGAAGGQPIAVAGGGRPQPPSQSAPQTGALNAAKKKLVGKVNSKIQVGLGGGSKPVTKVVPTAPKKVTPKKKK